MGKVLSGSGGKDMTEIKIKSPERIPDISSSVINLIRRIICFYEWCLSTGQVIKL